MSSFKPCFLVPCYNHGNKIGDVIDALLSYGHDIILVDDGSNQQTKEELQRCANHNQVILVTLEKNVGKGGAVIAGMKKAYQQCYSHAIQIDADGQHDLTSLPLLIEQARQFPTAVISGQPIYDQSIPKSRLYGRYLTHIWVWIETLSLSIQDSMCGFRAYPVGPTINIIERSYIGKRMDFDTEILVRLYWQGNDVRFVDTKVIYPEDGVSHFDALWDNVKISLMHTRLVLGMLPRIPALIKRTPSTGQHWSKHAEQGTIVGIKTLLAIYSLFGRTVFSWLLKPVIAYYYLTGKTARVESERYLTRLNEYAQKQQITLDYNTSSYQHLLSFGQTLLDKLAAWKGDFSDKNLTVHGIEHYSALMERERGIVLLGSHLGNLELCRALSRRHKELKINALVFTEHAVRFNTVLKAVNPDSELNIIQVANIGPETAILLQQKIEQGEWIVIVGDRTSVTKEQRVIWSDFLGKPAPFPQGPFMLASILKEPVYTIFGLRDESKAEPTFDVYFEPFKEQIILPRGKREEALQSVVDEYAQRLQHYTLKAPHQWYNFFDFWQLTGIKHDK
ncbi:MAG: glycosyltransferase family 2 protein [Aliivibrio sp.]|uniref:glycosyltransferase family 2 protein n=1 Tax=Aliivibrio sp. TaxID=1872443 RepID=UPI001A38C64E|nr:glycosyltransferase family 2 protein [Aliivibrio sp.]